MLFPPHRRLRNTRARCARVLALGLLVVSTTACSRAVMATPNTIYVGNPVLHLNEAENGLTVHTPTGNDVEVSLTGTTWAFSVNPPDVLQEVGAVVLHAGANCAQPGESAACGTTAMKWKTLKTGSVTITAQRSSCGEAIQCTASQGTYSVTVVTGHR